MARAPLRSLRDVASEVLEEVDREANIKTAEQRIVRAVAAEPRTDLGQLLHKVAAAVRADEDEVSYDDLSGFLREAGGQK